MEVPLGTEPRFLGVPLTFSFGKFLGIVIQRVITFPDSRSETISFRRIRNSTRGNVCRLLIHIHISLEISQGTTVCSLGNTEPPLAPKFGIFLIQSVVTRYLTNSPACSPSIRFKFTVPIVISDSGSKQLMAS